MYASILKQPISSTGLNSITHFHLCLFVLKPITHLSIFKPFSLSQLGLYLSSSYIICSNSISSSNPSPQLNLNWITQLHIYLSILKPSCLSQLGTYPQATHLFYRILIQSPNYALVLKPSPNFVAISSIYSLPNAYPCFVQFLKPSRLSISSSTLSISSIHFLNWIIIQLHN